MGLKNQKLIKSQKYEMFERVKFGYFEDFWNGSCKASWYDIVFFFFFFKTSNYTYKVIFDQKNSASNIFYRAYLNNMDHDANIFGLY